jgi:hypothetical protein
MPRRDATGPVGLGSRTGRGLGNCANGNQSNLGNTSRMLGNRSFFGRGFGNFCRGGFWRFTPPQQEQLSLDNKISELEQEISKLKLELNRKSED